MRSSCCKAPVKIGGGIRDGTHYFVCGKCDKACDLTDLNKVFTAETTIGPCEVVPIASYTGNKLNHAKLAITRESREKPKKRRVYHEDELQAACVDYFRARYGRDHRIISIPNAAKRSPVEGRRFKKSGLTAGVPDLQIPSPSGNYHGLWIELKHGKNRPTQEQTEMMEFLKAKGYEVAVCYTLDEFIHVVNGYFAWNN